MARMEEFKAIDPANLDKSVTPGEDFFSYANGNWNKNNPIPSDYSRWGAFEVRRDLFSAANRCAMESVLLVLHAMPSS
jgi:putative endopeptidase